MFYVETTGHIWGSSGGYYESLERAEEDAKQSSKDCFETKVWDCRKSEVGVLVCTYRKGQRIP